MLYGWFDFYTVRAETNYFISAMEVLLFFMASITGGIWCSYFVEYLEDKKMSKNLSDSE